MTEREINTVLAKWMSNLFGIPVIQSHQGIDQPKIDHAMIELSSFDTVGERQRKNEVSKSEENNSEGFPKAIFSPIMEVDWTFMVFYYGEDGFEKLNKLKVAQRLAQAQEPMWPDLKIREVGSINKVPELINEIWEPRFQVNLTLRGLSTDGIVVDTIEEHQHFGNHLIAQRS